MIKTVPKTDLSKNKELQTKKQLCYASGMLEKNVTVMDLSRRDSLNKMFGYKTYSSYLSNFDTKRANKNYAVSDQNKEYLDYASDFILNPKRLVYIAGVKHCFLPEFLSNDVVDLEMAINNISNKSDLLFSYKKLDNAVREIKAWTNKPFWITFLSLEIPIDKKYLKTQNIIKDINVFYFERVLKELRETDEFMSSIDGAKWDWVNGDLFFNLYSIYKLIPIRDGNTNGAYNILKSIFEGHKIHKKQIYKYYTELILCYYYNRFAGYSNQKKPQSENHFKNSVRNITFKYHAFIQFLKKLNLIDMEETTINSTEEKSENKYEQAIQEFFSKMSLNQEQKVMFYLGRMLNSVEYIQKGKTKTVIQKVNFNGMDKEDIQRLRISLIEKAKQYNSIGKVLFTDNEFGKNFNFNNWKLSPQEAVFFLLTGYSFGVGVKDADQLTEKETQETI
jgi:CRISPR-associated protein Csh1